MKLSQKLKEMLGEKDWIFLDYEYNETKEEELNVVCCSYETSCGVSEDVWLNKDKCAQKELALDLENLHSLGYIFVAYSAQAEARATLSLEGNTLCVEYMDWFDLFLEYRCLSNHSNKLNYGEQYSKGKVTKHSRVKGGKGGDSMAEACFKLLGKKIDTDEKTRVRDLIISAPSYFTTDEQEHILNYCRSDIEYLPQMLEKVLEIYGERLDDEYDEQALLSEILFRGEYAARTAIMEQLGYPIDVDATRNFSLSVNSILSDVQREINKLFPDIKPFRRNKDLSYSKVEKPIRDWIATTPYKNEWKITDSGKYSLALEAFTDHYHYRHTYPTTCFGAQMLRFLKLKQSLNGFVIAKTGSKKKFWDFVGKDGRVRAYLNPYKAQSSRTQPGATGFIPLKSAWMRALIAPVKGRAMGSIDFGSQEFLIAGLLSEDMAMLKAYKSGDVYLWWGIKSGGIPKGATKATHGELRDKYKSTTLGIQFGMTKVGLAKKLTADTGIQHSEGEAQVLIDTFFSLFYKLALYMKKVKGDYVKNRGLQLADGFFLWGDNYNERSVANCPIQGHGAVVMRKAVCLAQDLGLQVDYTLHDALTIESDDDMILEEMDILAKCMDQGFRFYFSEKMQEWAGVRLDGNIWGPDRKEEDLKTPEGLYIKSQNVYIDPRGVKEYNQFRRYFKNRTELEDL